MYYVKKKNIYKPVLSYKDDPNYKDSLEEREQLSVICMSLVQQFFYPFLS